MRLIRGLAEMIVNCWNMFLWMKVMFFWCFGMLFFGFFSILMKFFKGREVMMNLVLCLFFYLSSGFLKLIENFNIWMLYCCVI